MNTRTETNLEPHFYILTVPPPLGKKNVTKRSFINLHLSFKCQKVCEDKKFIQSSYPFNKQNKHTHKKNSEKYQAKYKNIYNIPKKKIILSPPTNFQSVWKVPKINEIERS